MDRIGFIGLGTMGRPMATNLLRSGHNLVVHDANPQAVEPLVALGARPAPTPRVLAAECDVVVTMLPAPPDVRAVVHGDEGVLAGLRRGGVLIDMSTIDPLTIKEIAQSAAARGVAVLDAPVSGTPEKDAAEGTLAIMVGGDEAVLERCRPILAAMGSAVRHVGGVGMGKVAKLCNNLICAISTVAVAEGFALGIKAGIDPAVLYDVVSNSSGNCWSLHRKFPFPGVIDGVPANHGYAGGFRTTLMRKDLRLALSTAQALEVPVALGALVEQFYAAASASGEGDRDFSVVGKVVQRLAAIPEATMRSEESAHA